MIDEMKIKTDFAKGFIGEIIKKMIKKNTDINTNIAIKELNITSSDETDNLIINVNVTISGNRNDLLKLIK